MVIEIKNVYVTIKVIDWLYEDINVIWVDYLIVLIIVMAIIIVKDY